ncbi:MULTISPECIES: P-II family nitrogen regulator [Nitrosopumilus]|uniref:Nitrogen regulatory protein P-II n=1 Tax=Nitrosopumilus piranensis TaxID=1582439 RepID=A0A0C5BYI1_9ARCH|nr:MULTISPECIES: P-II family nitrogen regulator [Nitrosopumilus]AJM92020.1 Nitrogen regulatory protein P-II [Nitrosopumilus piranensis]KAF6245224.1 transcriptional regulator [Nitrosopumilus sp. b2]
MKKIETIVPSGKKDAVIAAIKKIGVGGVTVHQVQGQGAQDPPLVGEFFSREMIICVADDPKVDEIINAIANVACTGTKGDGKVFVTEVVDALDICTKKRGTMDI